MTKTEDMLTNKVKGALLTPTFLNKKTTNAEE
jgi:hypothetical protein